MADGFIIESISKKSFDQINKFKKELIESIDITNKWAKALQTVKLPSQVVTQYKKTSQAIKETTKNISDYEKQIRSLENAQKKRMQATSEVSKQIAKLRVDTAELNKQNKQNAILTSKLTTEYQKQQVKLTILRKKYADLKLKQELGIKLNRQERITLKQTENAIEKKATALANVDAKMKIYNRNVGNYRSALNGLKGSLTSLIGAFGLTSGIFLFAGAVKDAFNRIREFDKSMQNIAGIMRVSREEIKDLEKVIIDVASSSIKTSLEVSKLAETLVTLGESKESIKTLLKPVNDLSIGLNTTSEDAGAFLINMLNAFGASRSEASKYADVIATIRTSTSLDFQKMRDSFQFIAPISKILNKDLAYTGAVIGILADNGIKAERAGRLLATSQQKLAKDGKTLSDALKELNDASKNGVKEQELLRLSTSLFDKQASAIGVVLAENTDLINENAEAIRGNKGALEDLTKEQLDSLDGKLKILNSSYEKFILNLDNGTNKGGKVAKKIIEELAQSFDRLGAVMDSRTSIIDKYALTINHLTSGFGALFGDGNGLFQDRVDMILAFGEAMGKATKEIEEQNRAFIELNGSLAPFTALQQQAIENTNLLYQGAVKQVETVSDLRKEISDLRKEIEETDKTDKKTIRTIQKKIKIKQKELNSILGVTKKTKKQHKVIKGTISYYQKEISKLQKLQTETAKTREEYDAFQKKIDGLKYSISLLTGEYDKLLKKLEQRLKKQDINKLIDDQIKKNNEEFEDFAKKEEQKQAIEEQKLKDKLFAQNKIKEAFVSLGETIGIQSQTVSELFDGFVNGFDDAGEAVEAFGSLFSDTMNALTRAENTRIENRIAMLSKEKEIALQYAGDSAETRGLIEERYQEKIKRLKRKQAENERENAIIQSIINTAVAVTKTLAELGWLAGAIPASLVGALGAAQTAIIASQPIPEFKDGVKDFRGGLALINEVRDEVIVTDKGITKPKGRNLLVDLPKGADVYPSEQDFIRELGSTLELNNITSPSSLNINGITKEEMEQVLRGTIGKLPLQKTILDKKGFTVYAEKQLTKTINLNNRITQKGISV